MLSPSYWQLEVGQERKRERKKLVHNTGYFWFGDIKIVTGICFVSSRVKFVSKFNLNCVGEKIRGRERERNWHWSSNCTIISVAWKVNDDRIWIEKSSGVVMIVVDDFAARERRKKKSGERERDLKLSKGRQITQRETANGAAANEKTEAKSLASLHSTVGLLMVHLIVIWKCKSQFKFGNDCQLFFLPLSHSLYPRYEEGEEFYFPGHTFNTPNDPTAHSKGRWILYLLHWSLSHVWKVEF